MVTIAHRVSSVKDCDEIIYLENGVIAERGTHEELLDLRGRYYEIYKEQYGELTSAIEGGGVNGTATDIMTTKARAAVLTAACSGACFPSASRIWVSLLYAA